MVIFYYIFRQLFCQYRRGPAFRRSRSVTADPKRNFPEADLPHPACPCWSYVPRPGSTQSILPSFSAGLCCIYSSNRPDLCCGGDQFRDHGNIRSDDHLHTFLYNNYILVISFRFERPAEAGWSLVYIMCSLMNWDMNVKLQVGSG